MEPTLRRVAEASVTREFTSDWNTETPSETAFTRKNKAKDAPERHSKTRCPKTQTGPASVEFGVKKWGKIGHGGGHTWLRVAALRAVANARAEGRAEACSLESILGGGGLLGNRGGKDRSHVSVTANTPAGRLGSPPPIALTMFAPPGRRRAHISTIPANLFLVF